MLKIKVNGDEEVVVDLSKDGLKLNRQARQTDMVKVGTNKYHLIYNNGSYTIELLDKNETGKELTVAVNGKKQLVSIKDDLDELLHNLGMDKMAGNKVNEVKAPMPGLVLKVIVKEGDAVKKGDALLMLEAMKMENVIKAVGDGVVKKVVAQPKQVVDKNQVLLVME